MKSKCISFVIFFAFVIGKSYGQYDNKFIVGFSTSGYYGSFTSESGLQQQAFYTELIPNIGLRVYDSLYVFIEGGRSFTTTKNIQEPPTFYMLGIFTRYYFKKMKVFDIYRIQLRSDQSQTCRNKRSDRSNRQKEIKHTYP